MRVMCYLLASVSICLGVVIHLSSLASAGADYPAHIAEMAELNRKIDYLMDRQKLHEVYLRYMRGFDRGDIDLMRTAFWPDAQINYGAQLNSFDEFVTRHLNLHKSQLSSWGHLITNETMDVNGDVAHVEAYVTALWMPNGEKSFAFGKPIVGGRYIDRLDRRNGEWRISVREFVPHFEIEANTNIKAWDARRGKSECAMGTWDRRDTSYIRPLIIRRSKEIGPPCAK